MIDTAYAHIPEKVIGDGHISLLFKEQGVTSFHQACDFVWRLPYGRTHHPYHFETVLSEARGTCSSKHALLKLLADEIGVAVELVIGLYPMNEANTPGVGVVLDQTSYRFIPEAHCYLRYKNARVDLTRRGSQAVEAINTFFLETAVLPQNLAKIKPKMHWQFIVDQYGKDQGDAIWRLREKCIAALSI